MVIQLDILIDEVRDELGDVDYTLLDDKLIYKALKDSYEFIQMIVDEVLIEEKYVKRCLIRLSTYKSYQLYSMLASIKDSSIPETAPLIMSTLLMNAYNCLTMIATVPLNEDLSLKETSYPLPIGAGLSNSSLITSDTTAYNTNDSGYYETDPY